MHVSYLELRLLAVWLPQSVPIPARMYATLARVPDRADQAHFSEMLWGNPDIPVAYGLLVQAPCAMVVHL
jgi:hypothetical protein